MKKLLVIDEELDVIAELEKIASDGKFNPLDVVKRASDPGCPLHRLFEWDDKKAARCQRLDQAAQLISGDYLIQGRLFQ